MTLLFGRILLLCSNHSKMKALLAAVIVGLVCSSFAEGNSRFRRQVGNIGNLGGFENSGFGTGTDPFRNNGAGTGTGAGTGSGPGTGSCVGSGGCSVGPAHLIGTKTWEICCQGKPAGYYAIYSTGCESFYRCVDGDSRVYCFDCGPGTKFNPDLNTCDWPQNVFC